jgi:hypothetical protein
MQNGKKPLSSWQAKEIPWVAQRVGFPACGRAGARL